MTETPARGLTKAQMAERIAELEAAEASRVEQFVEPGEADLARIQARSEGAKAGGQAITFYGRHFKLAPRIGLMPLLDFAQSAEDGVNSSDVTGMAKMRDLIRLCFVLAPPCRQCAVCTGVEPDTSACPNTDSNGGEPCFTCAACMGVRPDPEKCPHYDPGDWPAFHLAAIDYAAGGDELFEVVTAVIEMETARPTQPGSGSSPPGPRTSAKSKGGSSQRALPAGAEDLQPVGDLLSPR